MIKLILGMFLAVAVLLWLPPGVSFAVMVGSTLGLALYVLLWLYF
jgi:hypothetical protein